MLGLPALCTVCNNTRRIGSPYMFKSRLFFLFFSSLFPSFNLPFPTCLATFPFLSIFLCPLSHYYLLHYMYFNLPFFLFHFLSTFLLILFIGISSSSLLPFFFVFSSSFPFLLSYFRLLPSNVILSFISSFSPSICTYFLGYFSIPVSVTPLHDGLLEGGQVHTVVILLARGAIYSHSLSRKLRK
jgi:hypothetical protein